MSVWIKYNFVHLSRLFNVWVSFSIRHFQASYILITWALGIMASRCRIVIILMSLCKMWNLRILPSWSGSVKHIITIAKELVIFYDHHIWSCESECNAVWISNIKLSLLSLPLYFPFPFFLSSSCLSHLLYIYSLYKSM